MSGVAGIAIIVAGGVIGYELVGHDGKPYTPTGVPPKVPTTLNPTGSVAPTKRSSASSLGLTGPGVRIIGSASADPDALKTAIQTKIDELEKKVKAEYDALSCEAKEKGLAILKKKYPAVTLDDSKACETSYEDLAKIAGGAIGAGACNAIPGVGTLASPLCAIAGAYVADKIEQWIEANWNDATDWVQSEVSDATDWVESEAGKAWDALTSWL